MTIILRYAHIPRPDGTLRKAPFIPVYIKTKENQTLEVFGLLDSGADSTVVPKDLADMLGLKPTGPEESTGGIGGDAKVRPSKMQVLLKGTRGEKYTLTIPVLIMTENYDEIPLLLGRNGFFENFEITFKQKENKIYLKKIFNSVKGKV